MSTAPSNKEFLRQAERSRFGLTGHLVAKPSNTVNTRMQRCVTIVTQILQSKESRRFICLHAHACLDSVEKATCSAISLASDFDLHPILRIAPAARARREAMDFRKPVLGSPFTGARVTKCVELSGPSRTAPPKCSTFLVSWTLSTSLMLVEKCTRTPAACNAMFYVSTG